jgi:hypothetical protein
MAEGDWLANSAHYELLATGLESPALFSLDVVHLANPLLTETFYSGGEELSFSPGYAEASYLIRQKMFNIAATKVLNRRLTLLQECQIFWNLCPIPVSNRVERAVNVPILLRRGHTTLQVIRAMNGLITRLLLDRYFYLQTTDVDFEIDEYDFDLHFLWNHPTYVHQAVQDKGVPKPVVSICPADLWGAANTHAQNHFGTTRLFDGLSTTSF